MIQTDLIKWNEMNWNNLSDEKRDRNWNCYNDENLKKKLSRQPNKITYSSREHACVS